MQIGSLPRVVAQICGSNSERKARKKADNEDLNQKAQHKMGNPKWGVAKSETKQTRESRE